MLEDLNLAMFHALRPVVVEAFGGWLCSGGGRHAACLGRIARLVAIYPYKLSAAILRGFSRQLTQDGVMQRGFIGLHATEEEAEAHTLTSSGSSEFECDRISRQGGCSLVISTNMG